MSAIAEESSCYYRRLGAGEQGRAQVSGAAASGELGRGAAASSELGRGAAASGELGSGAAGSGELGRGAAAQAS